VREKHKQSAIGKKWTTIREERQSSERNKIMIEGTIFTIIGTLIRTVGEFKYLGRILDKSDNDWPAIQWAINQAQAIQAVQGHQQHFLETDGAGVISMMSIYKAVVQAVLLYGSESWVLTDAMVRTLQSFHQNVHQIYNRNPHHT
jgi:hypothetical protein